MKMLTLDSEGKEVVIIQRMPHPVIGIVARENLSGRLAGCPCRDRRGGLRRVRYYIAGFKSATTKRINALRGMPGAPVWQRNYYEHIIRNDEALNRIRECILTNPSRWHLDREIPLPQV